MAAVVHFKIVCRICPKCRRTKGVRTNPDGSTYCPKCNKLFYFSEVFPETCFKCGKVITDPTAAVIMGNNKVKHPRCRKPKNGEAENGE